jgi:homoserine dehydrogenase
MYYGARAGAGPTGSSIVADVIDIIRGEGSEGVANLGFLSDSIQALPVLDISLTACPFYLKLSTLDQAGVMAKLATILGQHDISIEALIQKDAHGSNAAIVIITNVVVESRVDAAILEIEALPEVQNNVSRIRIATLQD